MVRHYGNANQTRKRFGSLDENGCGKFNDLTEKVIEKICDSGYSIVWLTGIIEHATGTSYDGIPADDPLILKGKAGSPYAVRDYFDVAADLAEDPAKRIDEFKKLLARCKKAGLKVMIDFIPNHVARSYRSDVNPDLSFGVQDKTEFFFSRENHFFYLQQGEGPLMLPGGEYPPESKVGKVTGNNSATWRPSVNDWYETVKLNYGYDFTKGRDTRALDDMLDDEAPHTWKIMDAILAYWQDMGVDGFRVDMAHMVPMQFWEWVIKRSRDRAMEEVYFMAEAYDGDPAKLSDKNVLEHLMQVGFNTVYDGDTYELIKEIYEHGKWANDLDEVLFQNSKLDNMLRYAENHDEVRIASPQHWGGHGAKISAPVTAILHGIGKGPVMVYNGQEVGEPALGSEGFAGDDGRTSIFDYWSPPELAKMVNSGEYGDDLLSDEQVNLRNWYASWMQLIQQPAFAKGEVYGLNHFNKDNEDYGRLDGEGCSGHWLYSFVRYTEEQAYVVVVNLNPSQVMKDVEIHIPEDLAMEITDLDSHIFVDEVDACEVLVIEM